MKSVFHVLRFQQAIKENNFDLYLSSMYCLCPLLFAADQQNYARYLSYEYMELKNLSLTQPEAGKLLRDNGCSSMVLLVCVIRLNCHSPLLPGHRVRQ